MKRILGYAAIAAIGVLVLIQFVRPARTNPATLPERTLSSGVNVPPDVAAILERGCRDCHSNDTRWPWYSSVAPVSWFVIDHVNHGRRHFNYSDWARYDRDDASRLLKNSCELARKEAMPLASYLFMHPSARLSAADAAAICRWTQGVPAAASR